MKRNGLETEIRNIVFHLIRTSIKNEVKLTMQTVRNFGRARIFKILQISIVERSFELSPKGRHSVGTESEKIIECHEFRTEGSITRSVEKPTG